MRKHRILSLLLVMTLLTWGIPALLLAAEAGTVVGSDYEDYADLPADAWYRSEVQAMLDQGYMDGVENGCFDPDGEMSRAQMLVILHRMAGSPQVYSASKPFDDVPVDSWYSEPVLWAVSQGIVFGVGEDNFAPDMAITREQLITMLYRYSGAPSTEIDVLSAYTDHLHVADYAKSAMAWAVENGIINGSEGKLVPDAGMTRAQIAVILDRYIKMTTAIPVPGIPSVSH